MFRQNAESNFYEFCLFSMIFRFHNVHRKLRKKIENFENHFEFLGDINFEHEAMNERCAGRLDFDYCNKTSNPPPLYLQIPRGGGCMRIEQVHQREFDEIVGEFDIGYLKELRMPQILQIQDATNTDATLIW